MHITKVDKIIICAVILSVLGIGVVGRVNDHLRSVPAALQPQISYQLQSSGSAVVVDWPDTGQAAIGANGFGVLATSGEQTPVPTASIAKLITALAALKQKPITADKQGPILTLTQADLDIYHQYASSGGSVVPIAIGEQLTEYQVLQAMLLPSANNLADSLAIWAFGSLANYTTYANQMLSDYKLSSTHVGTDASGFSPTTTSTASDLVLLGELAADNPIISEIASQSTAVLPVAGTIKNVDWLLGTSGIKGLKTGNSDQAGGAFLFSAEYPVTTNYKITIIGAVMKATDLKDAMTKAHSLLVSAQPAFTLDTAITAGQTIGTYQVPWGSIVSITAASSVKALAYQGKIIDKPIVTLNNLKPPLAMNSSVGSIRTAASPSVSANITEPITQPSLWWRLTHK